MIGNVYLNEVKKYYDYNYIQYLLKLEAINYLKKEGLINEDIYLKFKMQIKNSHIC